MNYTQRNHPAANPLQATADRSGGRRRATAGLAQMAVSKTGLAQMAQRVNGGPAVERLTQLAERIGARSQPASLQRATSAGDGLPAQLKAGIQRLSGLSLEGVRVYRNSLLPAQLKAHALAQGTDIHLAPGQEHHLPHEAWHVVQQAQGRVRPTVQLKEGVPVNDDPGLEQEADRMGAKAMAPVAQYRAETPDRPAETERRGPIAPQGGGHPVQRVKILGSNDSERPPRNTIETTNVAAFKDLDFFKNYVEHKVRRHDTTEAEYFLTKIVQSEEEYKSGQHFVDNLVYDIRTKSIDDKHPSLQQLYMTTPGWTKRKNKLGNFLNRHSKSNLRIYRTMKISEWNKLRGDRTEGKKFDDTSALGAHLGDFKQANEYLYGNSEPKVLVEFVLKLGAHTKLFSPDKLALPKQTYNLRIPNLIRETLNVEKGTEQTFQEATTAEGTKPGMIGVKSERAESGFSLGISNAASSELFMNMVESMKVIGWSDGTTGSVESKMSGTLVHSQRTRTDRGVK
ncbi:eCIS core domain-containing protein [Azospirillum largimobile]